MPHHFNTAFGSILSQYIVIVKEKKDNFLHKKTNCNKIFDPFPPFGRLQDSNNSNVIYYIKQFFLYGIPPLKILENMQIAKPPSAEALRKGGKSCLI